jgi:hypothetical protein
MTAVLRRTAARDLDELLDKGVIQRLGAGRSAYYVLARNHAITLPIVPSPVDATSPAPGAANRAINMPNAPSYGVEGAKPANGKTRKDKKET